MHLLGGDVVIENGLARVLHCVELVLTGVAGQTANIKPAGFGYLVGASRKRCIGFISGIENPAERDEATAEIHSIAIKGGADIIRVHNVALAKEKALEDDKKFRS